MTVPFQQFIAAANIALDKAGGASSFADVIDAVIPTVSIDHATIRWDFGEPTLAVSIGDRARFLFPAVPTDEFHRYHFLSLDVDEVQSHEFALDLIPPTAAGVVMRMFGGTLTGNLSSNFLGQYPQFANVNEMAHGRVLDVPPRMVLRVTQVNAVIAAGPIIATMISLREVLKPPFDTLAASPNAVGSII